MGSGSLEEVYRGGEITAWRISLCALEVVFECERSGGCGWSGMFSRWCCIDLRRKFVVSASAILMANQLFLPSDEDDTRVGCIMLLPTRAEVVRVM